MTGPGSLLDLLDALVEARLDAGGVAELESRVLNDPESRWIYVQYLHVHGALSEVLTHAGSATPPGRPATPAASGLRRWGMRFAVAAAIVAAVPMLLTFIMRSAPSRHAPGALEPVAVLVDAHDAVWAEPGLSPGSPVRPGWVELRAGSAELEFNSGARVVLTGPAEFGLNGPMRGFLRRGRLAARVPQEAVGFTIAAPGVAVIDLGTEFTMNIGETGLPEVRVLKGRVKLKPDTGPERQLSESQAARLSDRGVWVTQTIPQDTQTPRLREVRIINPSFEEPAVRTGAFASRVGGWTLSPTASGGVAAFTEFNNHIPAGRQTAFLNSGEISQVLEESLAPGVRYTLRFDVGNRLGGYSPDFAVALLAGEVVLVEEANPVRPAKGHFAEARITFTAPPDHPAIGQPLKIVLRSNGSLATRVQNHFDNVRLLAEPASVNPLLEN